MGLRELQPSGERLRGARDHVLIQVRCIRVRDDDGGGQPRAVSQLNAASGALFNADPLHGCPKPNSDALPVH